MYRMKTFFRKSLINKASMNNSRNDISEPFVNNQIPIEFATVDNIRPSPSFMTVNRDLQKQSIYIDQYDGPSSLITISPDRKNDLVKSNKMLNPYQEERDQFGKSYSDFQSRAVNDSANNTVPALKRKSMNLSSTKGLLKTSKEQYQEFCEARDTLKEYNELKSNKDFLTKRDRIMKNGWRHGVVGVENPLSPDSDIYNDAYYTRTLINKDKNSINGRRLTCLKKNNNTSSQINFGVEQRYTRDDENKVVPIDHDWKSKKVSPERFINTHENIFVPFISPQKEVRKSKLIEEDLRGKTYNIVSGDTNQLLFN